MLIGLLNLKANFFHLNKKNFKIRAEKTSIILLEIIGENYENYN